MTQQDFVDMEEMRRLLLKGLRQMDSEREVAALLDGQDLATLADHSIITREEARDYLRAHYWSELPQMRK